MQITRVRTTVTDLAEAERCYAGLLDLPVERAGQGLVVRIGAAELHLRESPEVRNDHLAFTVSDAAFDAARTWLAERVEPIVKQGESVFEGPAGWDSRSVYFRGPSDSVLELIARRRLPSPARGGAFSPSEITGISETGIVVADVPGAARRLQARLGLVPFAGAPDADFAALGDDHGLLILCRTGRTWFPTADTVAVAADLEVDTDAGPPTVDRSLLTEG